MNDNNSKKLFIIQPPNGFESFDPGFMEIKKHLDIILSHLKISNYYGESISIKYKFIMEDIYIANAQRIDKTTYKVSISDGLARYFHVSSSTFLFDEIALLPWIDQCKINNDILKDVEQEFSKRELIAKYAYDIMIYCVILHEISHIILGHLDYLNDQMKLNYLSEFQDERNNYSTNEIKIRKALEAEADRQAAELSLIFFSNSLGSYLTFPSRLHAYEFYIYTITSLFRVLQDITQRKGLIHPKPNERLCNIFLGSLSKFLSQNFPEEHDEIYLHSVKSCARASKKFTLVDSWDYLTIAQNAMNLAFVDDVIKEINIRHYQHKLEFIGNIN